MDRTRWIRTVLSVALAGTLAAGAPARADDLTGPLTTPAWARWQGRVSLGLSTPEARAAVPGAGSAGLKVERLSVLGDYYFGEPSPSAMRAGGFRATSGLIAGVRAPLWAGQASLTSARGLLGVERQVSGGAWGLPPTLDLGVDTAPVPYLGVGYTELSMRSRWSFSADLGMVARSPGSVVKLGRVFTGSQGVDDLLRDLRLSPMLQLGVSYSF